jgi:hypothetical protein
MYRFARHLARFLLVSCFGTCLPLFAWWETGHQTVARIAVAHLSPAARTRLARLLNVSESPSALADALAKESTWADETKAQTKTGNWHFIDLALQDTKSQIQERCPDNNCAPARIRLFAEELRSTAAKPVGSQLDALRYLVHLVGDVHQPLHAVSDADLGGNCELLNPPVETAQSLHGLWDGGIIKSMDVDDKALSQSLEAELKGWSESRRNKAGSGDVDDWVWESHELSRELIYGKLHIPLEPVIFPTSCKEAPIEITGFKANADAMYVSAMKPIVREQLIKGGLRLAHLLNEVL